MAAPTAPQFIDPAVIDYLLRLGRAGRAVYAEYVHRDYDAPYLARQLLWFRAQQELDEKRGLRREPTVDIETFIESPLYMNSRGTVWPKVMEALTELNCSGRYQEAVLTGAIGAGKTSIAVWSMVYGVYALSCYQDPHALFGLDPADEIVIVFQSVTLPKAKEVGYDRLKARVQDAPYFQPVSRGGSGFTPDPNVLSRLVFPGRIIVKPISSAESGAIGENTLGGVLDEVNFLQVVEKSKQSADGGTFDQAVVLYQAIARRRESRFMQMGELPGMLCLVSSKRYPGEFTERKIAEARRIGEASRIYVYDKRVWEVKPWEGVYSGQMFWLFVGDQTRQPRFVKEEELGAFPEKDRPLLMQVPVEHRTQFEADMIGALRDIAGVSTMALHPYILAKEKVAACFGKVRSILSTPWCDFQEQGVSFYPKRWKGTEKYPRFVHLDLAKSRDSAGLAIGWCPGFRRIRRGDEFEEVLPRVRFDAVLEVRPPRGGEIVYEKIRSLLYKLTEFGLPIRWVTMDSYQSLDTQQILAGAGYATGYESVDTWTLPYDVAKSAFYDGRVEAPVHEKALSEWGRLEYDAKTGKIDHPTSGSKDLSDSMACVIYGLTMQVDTWIAHHVPLSSVPAYLLDAAESRTNSAGVEGALS